MTRLSKLSRSIAGKVAIVTGGNGGIGLGMAKGLAEVGAKVAVIGRNSDKNAKAVAEIEALGADAMAVETDVCDADAVNAMVAAVVGAERRPSDGRSEGWQAAQLGHIHPLRFWLEDPDGPRPGRLRHRPRARRRRRGAPIV